MPAAADPTVFGLPLPLGTAAVAAVVSLLVAVLTQVWTWRREERARRYLRRREALLDVQTAALAVRQELRRYGQAVREQLTMRAGTQPVVDASVDSRALDDAQALLQVLRVRLEPRGQSRKVDDALNAWLETAGEHYLSPASEPAAVELAAWEDLHRRVGTALDERSRARARKPREVSRQRPSRRH